MPSIIDMRTTVGSYGAVEFHLLVAAASEMAAFYELPFYGTAGCTDALSLDEQAVAEATMEIFSTLLSKANIVHDVGVGDHCNNVCPELVVLTDEIITMLGQYFRGVCFDTDSLAEELELIENVGPSGHFLHEVHTMEHFRDIHYSALFTRKANNQGPSEVRSRIRNSIESIWHTHQVPPLEQKMIQELQAMAVANGYN
jgi:trimethylamine--corrinoid protein Co-methyltransferase